LRKVGWDNAAATAELRRLRAKRVADNGGQPLPSRLSADLKAARLAARTALQPELDSIMSPHGKNGGPASGGAMKARSAACHAASLAAKYPGHVRKPYRTGRKPDEAKETVFEFCYDEYVGKSRPRADVWTDAKHRFGHSAPRKKDDIANFAWEGARRFEPELSMVRQRLVETGGEETPRKVAKPR
jgi:hypothetical protein